VAWRVKVKPEKPCHIWHIDIANRFSKKSDSVICQVVIEEEIKATKNEKQAQKTERACSAR